MIPRIDTALTDALSRSSSDGERADALFEVMRRRGQSFYDESVTQLAHALQAAHLATEHGATAEQITAALLHDIGHFVMDEHDDQSDFLAEDWYHETIGAKQLEPFFAEAVTEPIRLHVPAKRYLCTTDAGYFDGLSRASKRSYQLQGGKMTDTEVAEFEGHAFYDTALLVRRWDDGAKVPDWNVPELDDYREVVAGCLISR